MMETIILELERWVIAYNTPLRGKVREMDVITLLRNVTPMVRSDYAYKCRDAGLILPSEVAQFLPKTIH